MGTLPKPDATSQAHSDCVQQFILETIRKQGRLSFHDYMKHALYAPGLGYYSAGAVKIGEAGDFITAPEISPLFGQCVARQLAEVLQALSGGSVLELGAGRGTLAAQIMKTLAELNCLPEHYFILEVSADLRERQQDYLKKEIPEYFERVEWLASPPQGNWQGCVIANEVIDALPVDRFVMQNGVKEYFVAEKEGRLVWEIGESSQQALRDEVDALGLPEGYSSEILLDLPAWLSSVSQALTRGALFFIDYGFPQHEYYHPQRYMGTLMCHYRHHAHDDPLILAGIQDITAHVDFTRVANAAEQAGMTVMGYCAQADFLLSLGLLDTVRMEKVSDAEQFALAQQIKRLTLSSEMGELFKVMVLGKNLTMPLSGFSLRDKRSRL